MRAGRQESRRRPLATAMEAGRGQKTNATRSVQTRVAFMNSLSVGRQRPT